MASYDMWFIADTTGPKFSCRIYSYHLTEVEAQEAVRFLEAQTDDHRFKVWAVGCAT